MWVTKNGVEVGVRIGFEMTATPIGGGSYRCWVRSIQTGEVRERVVHNCTAHLSGRFACIRMMERMQAGK